MCPRKVIFSLFFLMLNRGRNWISFSFLLGLPENLLTVRVLQTGYKCMLDCWSDNRNLSPNAEAFLRKNLEKVYFEGTWQNLQAFFQTTKDNIKKTPKSK